jgi:hypothetical protein
MMIDILLVASHYLPLVFFYARAGVTKLTTAPNHDRARKLADLAWKPRSRPRGS